MKIYPSTLPEEIINDPFKGSELIVYRALEGTMVKGVTLYSVPWHEIDKRRGICREGEIDFLVILPMGVVLVAEVKGGRISADIEGWYTTDRRDIRHPIMSPLEQAQRSKYAIKSSVESKFPGVRFGHIAIFPNISRADFQSSIDCPFELMLFSEDIQDIGTRIYKIADLFSTNCHPIQVEQLANYIKPRRELVAKTGAIVHQLDNVVNSLTESQYAILRAISGNPRVGLTGPAGSGKSVLGLRWARDLIAANKSVMTFSPHKRMSKAFATFLDTSVGHWLHNDAFDVASIWRADAILVEEAQDLPLDKWDAIEGLSRRYNAKILAIYDSNQKLAPKGCFYLPENMIEVTLDTIIRNSEQIAKYSLNHYLGNVEAIRIAGPRGPEVIHVNSSPSSLIDDVKRAVLDAIRNHGFDYNSIVVISGSKEEVKKFVNSTYGKPGSISFRSGAFESGKVKSTSSYDRSTKASIISCFSHMRFRGMESPVVILTDIDQLSSNDRQIACYVGASRAKYLLYVIHTSGNNCE